MRQQTDAKAVMLDHSKAKVELFGRYLSVYLNILGRVSSVDRIYIFDLLCGEGVYQDGSKGSPIVALEKIRDHYFANGKSCPAISIWLNDNGASIIEPGKSKIDRVQSYSSKIYVPSSVDVRFSQEEFDQAYARALKEIQTAKGASGLFFIDPYGYKLFGPAHVKEIMDGDHREVILFLPISFMYRFARKALLSPSSGSEPLQKFLRELFGSTIPNFSSIDDFLDQIKEKFRGYLSANKVLVDTFTLERDTHNLYSLFFFTRHSRGFEKMLETKWQMDTNNGRGFKLDPSPGLFTAAEISGYPQALFDFIKSSNYRTNEEIYQFGLAHGFLPKHTNDILKGWKQQIEVISLDGQPARGYYISYNSDRCVGLRIIPAAQSSRGLL